VRIGDGHAALSDCIPGDILIQRGGTTFYFRLVTCLLISVVLSGLLWLFNR
jgi:hypothetical protein